MVLHLLCRCRARSRRASVRAFSHNHMRTPPSPPPYSPPPLQAKPLYVKVSALTEQTCQVRLYNTAVTLPCARCYFTFPGIAMYVITDRHRRGGGENMPTFPAFSTLSGFPRLIPVLANSLVILSCWSVNREVTVAPTSIFASICGLRFYTVSSKLTAAVGAQYYTPSCFPRFTFLCVACSRGGVPPTISHSQRREPYAKPYRHGMEV